MPTRVPRTAIVRSRQMRKSMPSGEARLWSELKAFCGQHGLTVRRQVPIGPYFADFAIQKHRLVIELDGEHHFTPHGQRHDAQRDAYFAELGYRIFRINTGELAENLNGCIESILRELGLT